MHFDHLPTDERLVLERAHELAVREHRREHEDRRVVLVHLPQEQPTHHRFRCAECPPFDEDGNPNIIEIEDERAQ